MRFIRNMNFDPVCFVSAVISLASKGYLTIGKTSHDNYQLKAKSDTPDSSYLSKGEKLVFNRLFSRSRRSLSLIKGSKVTINHAMSGLESHFERTYDKRFFLRNRKFLIPGLVLTLLTWFVTLIYAGNGEETLFLGVWLSFWTVGTGFLVHQVARVWMSAVRPSTGFAKASYLGSAVFHTLFAVPFVVGWIIVAGILSATVGWKIILAMTLVVLVNITFFSLIRRYTHLGRKLMDEIDGTAEYISVAEKDHLAMLHAPEQTPETFETLFPYAVALGLEKKWTHKFEAMLVETGETNAEWTPSWYQGTSEFSSSFHSALASGLSGAVATSTATQSSSSSSGSFGGGSSGGGGGGGVVEAGKSPLQPAQSCVCWPAGLKAAASLTLPYISDYQQWLHINTSMS
jgi:uncharacterized membrane protein YgcG